MGGAADGPQRRGAVSGDTRDPGGVTLRVVIWHRAVPSTRARSGVGPWARARLGGLAAAHGGAVAGVVGSAVAVVFPGDRADGALATADAYLAAAAAESRRVALGIAIGEVEDDAAGLAGEAYDRAQALAGRAGPGEALVLAALAGRAKGRWEFVRRRRAAGPIRGLVLRRAAGAPDAADDAADDATAETARGGARGDAAVVDGFGEHPAAGAAGESVDRGPADPWAEPLERVRDLALLSGVHRVGLRFPVGVPTDAIAAALRPHDTPKVWRLPGATGGFEPLGALRRGLVTALGPPGRLREAPGVDPEDADLLVAIAEGRAVERDPTVRAVRRLLAGWGRGGARPWLLLTDPGEADGASLDVIGRATADGVDALVVALLGGEDATVPPALAAWGPFADVRLAPRPGEAEGPAWRPAAEAALEGLPAEPRRALAAFATVPPELAVELVAGSGAGADAALDALRAGGWLRPGDPPEVASPAHRALVAERVGADTRAALSSRALERLEWLEEALPVGAFARAEAGWLALSSGRRDRAARELMAVASTAAGHRFHRAATELAVLALRADASPAMQEAARRVARQADEAARESHRPPPPSSRPSAAPPPTRPSERGRRRPRSAEGPATSTATFPRPATERPTPAPGSAPPDATPRRDETGPPPAGDGIAGWRSAPPSAAAEPAPEAPPEDTLDALLEEDDDADTVPPSAPRSLPTANRRRGRGGARDLATFEAALEEARGRGADPAAVERLSAVAFLLRGELAPAVERLERDQGDAPRPLLAKALLALALRDADGATRLAAEALLRARRDDDPGGVAASLRALEACYRWLGRDAQADALRRATEP